MVGQAVESGRMSEITGAREALSELRSRDLGICLTTGFSRGLQTTIIEHLGWGDLVDFSLAPGPGLRGRPYPDMVLAAMLQAQVDDVILKRLPTLT
jgi:beta-phosphoglucomutase-like phosphatase (HAD superfamily)